MDCFHNVHVDKHNYQTYNICNCKVLECLGVMPDAANFITFFDCGTYFIYMCSIALFSMLAVTSSVMLTNIFNFCISLSCLYSLEK